jgi:hypothetical protein
MSTPDQVLSDFIDAWNAGRRPRVRDYLDRVPEGEARDELAGSLSTWLEHAPTPAYDAAVRAEIRASPAVQAAFAAAGGDGTWASALPALRERAGLDLRGLASKLVERLGWAGDTARADRAAGYLGEMERGDLGPDRVSRRLLDALGGVLGVTGAALADLGAAVLAPPPSAAPGATLFRADEAAPGDVAAEIAFLSEAALSEEEPMDELDRLFLGGPGA